MIDRKNIRHAAMLKSDMTKCLHIHTKKIKIGLKCIHCGMIKPDKGKKLWRILTQPK